MESLLINQITPSIRNLWTSDQLHILLPSLKALCRPAPESQRPESDDTILQQTLLDVLSVNNVSWALLGRAAVLHAAPHLGRRQPCRQVSKHRQAS